MTRFGAVDVAAGRRVAARHRGREHDQRTAAREAERRALRAAVRDRRPRTAATRPVEPGHVEDRDVEVGIEQDGGRVDHAGRRAVTRIVEAPATTWALVTR